MATNYFRMGVLSCALAVTACSGSEPEERTNDKDDLAIGSSGPKVREVFDYLTRYGYFENPTLRETIQGWQPILADVPAEPEVFDDVLEEGVRTYQKLMGLSVTGVVDAETRGLMAKPRCGHPDHDPDRDEIQKFHATAPVWPFSLNVKYFWSGFTSDISREEQRVAIVQALNQWQTVSEIVFQEVTEVPRAHMHFNFANLGQGCNPLGSAKLPPIGEVLFNDTCDWRVTNLRAVAAHEIGHALGLKHSSEPTAVMFPFVPSTPLTIDDIQAIGVHYGGWEQTSGLARDISIGSDGWIWAVGTGALHDGSFQIWRANTASANLTWESAGAVGGTKVAAVTKDNAWTIRANGVLWQYINGTWFQQTNPPGVTCVDLAVPASTRPWCVGSDGNAYEFLPSSGNWASHGPATRVDSGPFRWRGFLPEVAWKIGADGRISRRLPESPLWKLTPALPGGIARDIGVGQDGSVWAVGGEESFGARSIFIWNEQFPSVGGSPPAEDRFHWVKIAGGATDVAVTPQGAPWVLGGNFIYRRLRR